MFIFFFYFFEGVWRRKANFDSAKLRIIGFEGRCARNVGTTFVIIASRRLCEAALGMGGVRRKGGRKERSLHGFLIA